MAVYLDLHTTVLLTHARTHARAPPKGAFHFRSKRVRLSIPIILSQVAVRQTEASPVNATRKRPDDVRPGKSDHRAEIVEKIDPTMPSSFDASIHPSFYLLAKQRKGNSSIDEERA